MTDTYNNAGLPLYSPTTHLHVFCSMSALQDKISRRKEKAKDRRDIFMTPLVPFAGKADYNNEDSMDVSGHTVSAW